MYVSIWTASFDAVFGQRLHLPENAIAFSGLKITKPSRFLYIAVKIWVKDF